MVAGRLTFWWAGPGHRDCSVRRGGVCADLAANTSFGPNSARVAFLTNYEGGNWVEVCVANRYTGSCPSTPPQYC